MKRVIALFIAALLPATQAVASDLSDSVAREAVHAAAQQSRPAARGENPYMTPGVVMLAGGGLVMLYGFVHETGVDCTYNSNYVGTSASAGCSTTHNTGMAIAGAAIASVGGVLLWKGSNRSPSVTMGPSQIAVTERFAW